mmetsp:Transcript_36598/g.89399  ORF Transcript_36598/g.89399 Transcript_36598/m.89399 type:complete len:201 (-) Transcript_36598:8-610(-)
MEVSSTRTLLWKLMEKPPILISREDGRDMRMPVEVRAEMAAGSSMVGGPGGPPEATEPVVGVEGMESWPLAAGTPLAAVGAWVLSSRCAAAFCLARNFLDLFLGGMVVFLLFFGGAGLLCGATLANRYVSRSHRNKKRGQAASRPTQNPTYLPQTQQLLPHERTTNPRKTKDTHTHKTQPSSKKPNASQNTPTTKLPPVK